MRVKRILQRTLGGGGFLRKHAEDVATIFVSSSLDGIYPCGVNRFPRAVEYLDKGKVDSGAIASCEFSMGATERWSGHRGFSPFDIKLAMNRAVELAKEHGVGVAALGNSNHRICSGSYGQQATGKGYIGICWSDTVPNVPAWGGKDREIGNNPFIMPTPRSSGEHTVIDYAVSRFSYGKIEEVKLKGQQLPVPGGYDTKDNLTIDPAEIEKTQRVLPMGYWKGDGISIALNLIATVLTNGNSVNRIDTFGDKVGLSRVTIVIDPLKFNTPEETDSIVDEILVDIKSSEPIREGAEVYYPGELELITKGNNTRDGIPVINEIREALNSPERQKIAFESNIEGRFSSRNVSQEY